VIPDVGGSGSCACHQALRDAIVTPRERISSATRRRVGLLIERHVGKHKGGR
jgi:hypothetical protein